MLLFCYNGIAQCLLPCCVRADHPCWSWFFVCPAELALKLSEGQACYVCYPVFWIWCVFLWSLPYNLYFFKAVRYQIKCFPVWAENREGGIKFIMTFWFFRSWIFTASHVEFPRPTFPTRDRGSKVQILVMKDSFSEAQVVLCCCSSVKINTVLLQCRIWPTVIQSKLLIGKTLNWTWFLVNNFYGLVSHSSSVSCKTGFLCRMAVIGVHLEAEILLILNAHG